MTATLFFAWLNLVQLLILALGSQMAFGPEVNKYSTILGSLEEAFKLVMGSTNLRVMLIADGDYSILVCS